MKGVVISLFAFLGIYIKDGLPWTCPADSEKVFQRQIRNTEIRFDVNTSAPDTLFACKIWSPSDITLLSAVYFNGNVLSVIVNETLCTFTGSVSNGQLYISLKEGNLAGVYRIEIVGVSLVAKCVRVYILGQPTRAQIFIDKDPSVGGNVTLTCSSTSTTTPSNHSLSLVYEWTVNGLVNPSDTRYIYTTLRRSITVSGVVKQDSGKQFVCTATEQVSDGYTSNKNGPDSVTFSPEDTVYKREEGTVLQEIQCKADCNPPCSFSWTKKESGKVFSLTAILQLETLDALKAGTYVCRATGSSSFPSVSSEVTVLVISPTTRILQKGTTIYHCRSDDETPTYSTTVKRKIFYNRQCRDKSAHATFFQLCYSSVYGTIF